MDSAVKTKQKESTLPSEPRTTARELGGFFFAIILAVCYEFLCWLNSLRGERYQADAEERERLV